MLAVVRGRDDPRHRRQRAVLDIVTEGLQEAFRHGVAETLGERAQRVVDARIVERAGGGHRLPDVHRRHVNRAARLRHLLDRGAPVAEAHHLVAAEIVDQALVDLPAHARLLQPVGIGGPGPARGGRADVVAAVELVVERGHAHRGVIGRAQAVRAVGAAPVEQAVGDGAGVHAAVIRIADREGIGQRAMEGHLGGFVVAERERRFRGWPGRHAAMIPGGLRIVPGVRRAAGAQRVAQRLVEVVGRERAGRAGLGVALVKDVGRARRRWHREAVAVAAHAAEGAEVAVERAVLEHQQHHVLDVLERAGGVVGIDRERAPDRGRKARERGRGGRALPSVVFRNRRLEESKVMRMGFQAGLGRLREPVRSDGCRRRRRSLRWTVPGAARRRCRRRRPATAWRTAAPCRAGACRVSKGETW